MPTVTADKIVNHDIYAKNSVSAYDGTLSKVVKTFDAGSLIGNVYAWITDNSGNVWWMVYLSPNDYNNFNPSYIKHSSVNLDVPDLPGILQQIEDEQKAAEIAKNGVVSYYFNKYLPYIVGGIVLAIAFPAIYKSVKRK
jgi:hypothetical protein